ncbi:hypothetical protein ERX46_06935 [Brumimicrobium glaciale]|uniref:Lipoprotein n=1 Tax=Brumimicrobium glaciale TaxID=200475 RepID=A0A4Q4KNV8_9FLAO|nr:hypothetical protein [Brumimicrobium glaciale]RYM35105.1 hypothetical protein ERX46_06935 [Brumimicrobium glaciale]
MKQFLFIISALLLIVSCESSVDEKEQIAESTYANFFYPTDSLIPYIYVFSNVNEPLDEKVLRIYRTESATDTSLIVEFYNSDLKITEGYTHDLTENFKVVDHMIVDGDGLKRQAKLSSFTFFPKNNEDKTQFISDFPSHLDSISMIYQSKRRVLEEDKMVNVLGDNVPAIIIEDSVKVLFANPFTKKSSAQSVMITRTFAKGYGMVRWSADNEKIVYELTKILPNKWWDEFGQSPQIKL